MYKRSDESYIHEAAAVGAMMGIKPDQETRDLERLEALEVAMASRALTPDEEAERRTLDRRLFP